MSLWEKRIDQNCCQRQRCNWSFSLIRPFAIWVDLNLRGRLCMSIREVLQTNSKFACNNRVWGWRGTVTRWVSQRRSSDGGMLIFENVTLLSVYLLTFAIAFRTAYQMIAFFAKRKTKVECPSTFIVTSNFWYKTLICSALFTPRAPRKAGLNWIEQLLMWDYEFARALKLFWRIVEELCVGWGSMHFYRMSVFSYF